MKNNLKFITICLLLLSTLLMQSCLFSGREKIGVLKKQSNFFIGDAKLKAKHQYFSIWTTGNLEDPIANKKVKVWVKNLSNRDLKMTLIQRKNFKERASVRVWIILKPNERKMVYSGPAFTAVSHVASGVSAKIRIEVEGLSDEFSDKDLIVLGTWDDGP